MENRNLRKVEYGYEKSIGYFHQFFYDPSRKLIAVIESEDGKVGTVSADGIRFIKEDKE